MKRHALYDAWKAMIHRQLRQEAQSWTVPEEVDRLVRRVQHDLHRRFGSDWAFRSTIADVRAGVQRYFIT